MKEKLFLSFLFLGFFSCIWASKPLKPFSEMEMSHVRVKNPTVFGQSKEVVLNLGQLKEDQYAFPLPGAKVISGYGARNGHSGADIKTKARDTIRCAFDGIVRMAKSYGGYGKIIVVRHAKGLESLYSHNAKNFVACGDHVKAGQPIGLTGRTGRATTEHLHFEFRIDGEHFNPNIIFNLKEHTLRKEDIVCRKTSKGIIVKPLKKEEN